MDRKSVPSQSVAQESIGRGAQALSTDHHGDLPPAYTSSGLAAASQNRATAVDIPSFPQLNYSYYRPPSSSISSDRTTVLTVDRTLNASAPALIAFIRQQASLPPKPFIRITGSHNIYTGSTAIDFDLKLNLLPYLYRPPPNQPWNYVSILEQGEQGYRGGSAPTTTPAHPAQRGSKHDSLEAWAKAYVSESSTLKYFVLTREVTNLDIDALAGQIRVFFAALKYRGMLDIRLESTYARVKVQAGSSSGGAGAFLRPVFKVFAGEKKFEVARAVWPFASTPSGDGREFAVLSEVEWWAQWKDAVGTAAVEGRKGWVTVEDRLECAMGGAVDAIKAKEWGTPESGYSNSSDWKKEWGWSE